MNINMDMEYEFRPLKSDDMADGSWRMECCGRLYCTRGNITVVMKGDTYHLVRNASLSLLPGSVIAISSWSEDYEGYRLLYTYEFFQRAADGLDGLFPFYTLNPLLVRDDESAADTITVLRMMQKLSDDETPMASDRALCLMRFFLMGVCERARQSSVATMANSKKSLRPEEYFQRFIFEISSRYKTVKTVEGYSRTMGISAKHLNDCCRRIVVKTAKEVIDNYLLTQIRNELHHTSRTVAEISAALGFNEPTEICRFVKRLTGKSPNSLRTTNRDY